MLFDSLHDESGGYFVKLLHLPPDREIWNGDFLLVFRNPETG